MSRALSGGERVVGLLLLCGLALTGAACSEGPADAAAAPEPTPVEAVMVIAPGADDRITATGQLERTREMTLSFRIPGVITSLTVNEGDAVKEGQVLASIDPAGVAAAEARASAEVERASRDLERDRTLFERGFVSQARLDDRESALKAAEALAAAAAFDRRWARLVSPATGVVLLRTAQTGEVVQPGQAVLRIADEASPLTLRVPLADRIVSRVRAGAPVAVRVEGAPQIYSGKVVRIGERSGPQTGAVNVEIEIAGGGALRSGQIATAQITVPATSTKSSFAKAPAEAILEAQGRKAFVFVVEGGKARRRAVEFGGFDGDEALVAGLAPDARVITAGAGFVADGEPVRILDREPAPQPAG